MQIDPKTLRKAALSGPQMVFVRLAPSPSLTKEVTEGIGQRYTSLLRSAGISDSLYAIDDKNLLATIADGAESMAEMQKFLLGQPEVDYLE